MNANLTISEVAKLLNVSAHTIRYYDKEGLIKSHTDPESGYRMFDLDDLTHLANIIILRDSGIPIKQIKTLIDHYSVDTFREQLLGSLDQLDNQMKKLTLQKQVIQNTLSLLEKEEEAFIVNTYPVRYLSLVSVEDNKDSTAKEFYQDLQKNPVPNLLYQTIVYELHEDQRIVSFSSDKKTDYVLKAGDYLEYPLTIKKEADLDSAINDLFSYVEIQALHLDSDLYMSIPPHAMLVVDDGYKAKLFCKILD